MLDMVLYLLYTRVTLTLLYFIGMALYLVLAAKVLLQTVQPIKQHRKLPAASIL